MSDKPNFIVFMSDDQGHRDLSCMGATDFQTPNFDRIASRGAKLTRWYSNAPICSAGRCGILTGRYPIAAGIPGNVGVNADGLSPDLPTIPKALKKLGYQTCMSGKWHLGNREPFLPHNHGFDHWFGFTNGCIDYYSHTFYWALTSKNQTRHDLWEDGIEVYRNGTYFVDLMCDKAIEYIQKAKNDGRPFFMYIPFNTPHYPLHAPEEYMERFAHLSRSRQLMTAMLTAAGGDPEQYNLDGTDILPMIADNAPSPHLDLFWTQGPKGHTRAIQRDRYKLLLDQNEIHLSNLNTDPNETTNIAGDEPDLTNDLLTRLNAWHASVTQ